MTNQIFHMRTALAECLLVLSLIAPVARYAIADTQNPVTPINYRSEVNHIVAMRLGQIRAEQEQDLMKRYGHAVMLPTGRCSAYIDISDTGALTAAELVQCTNDDLTVLFNRAIHTSVFPAMGYFDSNMHLLIVAPISIPIANHASDQMTNQTQNQFQHTITIKVPQQSPQPFTANTPVNNIDALMVSNLNKNDKLTLFLANSDYAMDRCKPFSPDKIAVFINKANKNYKDNGVDIDSIRQTILYKKAYANLVKSGKSVSDQEERQFCEKFMR